MNMAYSSDEIGIKIYFEEDDWHKLSDYEKIRYINLKRNYEVLKSLGLKPNLPQFMLSQKKSNEMVCLKSTVKEGSTSNKERPSYAAAVLASRNKTPGRLCKNNAQKRKSDDLHSTSDKPHAEMHPAQNVKKEVPFNEIMKKVVFVLSGFVNPMRNELRCKALQMGAKYKSDWDSTCTHLVCAFLNTPKYRQAVNEYGKIVTEEWIINSYKKKKLLPWREYVLESNDTDISETEESETTDESFHPDTSESEESETDIKLDSNNANGIQISNKKRNPSDDNKKSLVEHHSPSVMHISESENEDESAFANCMTDTNEDSNSGRDTEDEIRKVESEAKKTDKDLSKKSAPAEDNFLPEKCGVLPSLNIFKGKHFYLFGDFLTLNYEELRCYITAYNGVIEDYLSDNVKYVVTEEKWDIKFEEAICKNEDLIFIKSVWVYKCHEAGKLVPYQPYIIVPDL